ncbi:Ig-like domain (group 2) [Acetitomaculum ruminis DSM 5522]|uniref:Ig-like domain (Group 2) n=1 Tax=Acetitomaculum ruminis DSM 5522 TaxID=1120918 RepID=A0A1I1AF31_9FIRM|nr:Ig-like domain-containing protein [Acetitomaculum ruminis]SFB35098.1 Ig-like domain (group 2) [Acetitomaculum ruminis DSM 5522]
MKNYSKKFLSLLWILALIFTLFPAMKGNAQESLPADCMEQIFAFLTREDSDYSQYKAQIAEASQSQFVLSEELKDNTITITTVAKGDYEEFSGSWDFTLDGNYLKATIKDSNDITGAVFFYYLESAVSDYLGMDSELVNGYINGLIENDINNEYFMVETDENTDAKTLKLYLGSTYEMKELDTFYLDSNALSIVTKFTKSNNSGTARIGKISLYYSGDIYSSDIYIAEHGGLTDLAYKSILEAVKKLKPQNYRYFLDTYKKIEAKQTDQYQVSIITNKAKLPEVLQSLDEHNHFIKIHFSAPSLSSTSVSLTAGSAKTLKVTRGSVKNWTSSNKAVATVKNGCITALKKGTTTITVTLAHGTKLTCKVTVKNNPSIKINGKTFNKKTTYTIKKGKYLTVKVSGKAKGVNNTYASSKKSIAKVTSARNQTTVKIKGLKVGTSNVTIKVNGVAFVIKVKVK